MYVFLLVVFVVAVVVFFLGGGGFCFFRRKQIQSVETYMYVLKGKYSFVHQIHHCLLIVLLGFSFIIVICSYNAIHYRLVHTSEIPICGIDIQLDIFY